MKRTTRMLLVVAAFAVVAMLALSAMLSRYNRMTTQVRSVSEIEKEYAAAAEEQRLEEAKEIAAPDDGAAMPEAAQAEAVLSETDVRVEQFVSIRGEIRELIAAQEKNPERWVDTTTGTFADDLQPYALDELRTLMIKIRLKRLELCKEQGIREADYLEVRDAFRAWRSGAAIEAELQDAFAARQERLDEFDLGMLEELDG